MKTFILLLAILILCSGCKTTYTIQEGCGYIQNVYGERIQWRTKAPVPLYIHESVPIDYRSVIISTIGSLEQQTDRKLFLLQGLSIGPLLPRQDGLNVIYWSNELTDETTATTRVYSKGDSILEIDIRINAQKLFYIDTPSFYDSYHLESIMLHELGHSLGIGHSSDPNSIMYPTIGIQTKKNLNEADIKAIHCGY